MERLASSRLTANTGDWVQQNVTSALLPTKSLDELRVWGYSEKGQTDFTSYDDFMITVTDAPEPASLVGLAVGLAIAARSLRARS